MRRPNGSAEFGQTEYWGVEEALNTLSQANMRILIAASLLLFILNLVLPRVTVAALGSYEFMNRVANSNVVTTATKVHRVRFRFHRGPRNYKNAYEGALKAYYEVRLFFHEIVLSLPSSFVPRTVAPSHISALPS